MKTEPSSSQHSTFVRRLGALIAVFAISVLLFGILFPRLSADPGDPTPTIQFTQGLLGKQVCLQWDAEEGVQYVVQKAPRLVSAGTPSEFVTVALVTAESTACQWVDPALPGAKAFYRIEIPAPTVFALEPPVVSTNGGDIFLRAQCLPPGSFLLLEMPGHPPIFVLIDPVPGYWRATVSAAAVAGIPAGTVLTASVVDINGVTVASVEQTVTVTETGFATDAPPWLPPAAPVAESPGSPIGGISPIRGKPRPTTKREAPSMGEECDDGDQAGLYGRKAGNDKRQDYISMTVKRSEAENTIGALASGSMARGSGGGCGKASYSDLSMMIGPNSRGLPGEVTAEQCDLALPCPAGSPLDWVRTYRSKAALSSGHGAGWNFSFNIYIEPIPLAAGVNAPVVVVHDGAGRADRFERQGDGTYRCAGMFREGYFNADSSFTLTFADKGTWIFCPLVGAPWSGRIGSITDRNGVSLTCTYSGGQLATVSDAFGRSITLTWLVSGQIGSVADSTGRSVSYTYYAAGEVGGSPGDLKSVSCPQLGGVPPAFGPTTYTYTTGFTDDRLNHNLLSATDGAGRNLGAFTYATTVITGDPDFDTVASMRKGHELTGNVTLYKIGPAPSGPGNPGGGVVIYENDEVGRVSEMTCDRQHRPTSVRQYTGFATTGVPVTATTNRPTGKLRPTDPDFYETTFLYNGQHLCTRVTLPDGTQERTTYECDINPASPVRVRANARVCTLVSSDGQQRTVTMEYQPGFGTSERRLPVRNLGSSGQDGVSVNLSAARRLPVRNLGSSGQDGVEIKWPPLSMVGKKAKAWMVNNFEVHPVFTSAWGEDRKTMPEDDWKVPVASVQFGDSGGSISYVGPCDASATREINQRNLPSATVLNTFEKTAFSAYGNSSGGDIAYVGPCDAQGCDDFRTSLTTAHGQTFTNSYDANGNCTSSRTPIAGGGTDATYNTRGQCTSVTELNGPGSSFTTQAVYDAATGFCTSVITDPAGLHLTVSFDRDTNGRITRVVDERGFDWIWQYNESDLCFRTQTPVVGTSRISTDYFYDAGGLLARVDVEHRDATGALDAANPTYTTFILRESPSRPRWPSRIAVEERPVAVPTVPPMLAPVPATLGSYAVTDFLYDAAGQCVRVTTPAASREQAEDAVYDIQYDERGFVYRGISGGIGAMTSVTEQYDYDALGACTAERRRGNDISFAELVVTKTMDSSRRPASITDPMGNVITYAYDEQGSVTVSVFGEVNDVPGSAGNVLLARNKITKSRSNIQNNRIVSDGGGKRADFRPAFFDVFVADDICIAERFIPGGPPVAEITTVHRSPAGLVQSITRNGDTLLSCAYDTASRLYHCSNGACADTYVLDASGNVTTHTRTDTATLAGTPAKSYTFTLTVDSLGRTVQCRDSYLSASSRTLDSLNRTVSRTEPGGQVWHVSYDGDYNDGLALIPYSSLVTTDVNNDGIQDVVIRSYCRSGECRSTTNSNSYTTTFTRDGQCRLTQCDHPDGTHEFFLYDTYGRLSHNGRQDGSIRASSYDLNGRETSAEWLNVPATVVGVPPTVCQYDGLGRETRRTQGASDLIRTYDSLGNELSESHNGFTVTRTFNHRGRTGVTYPDGNRFGEVRDDLGRLRTCSAVTPTGVVISPPVVSMEYLGGSALRSTTANGVVTNNTYRGDGDSNVPGTGTDFSFDACVQSIVTGPGGVVLADDTTNRDRNQRVIRTESAFTEGSSSTRPLRRKLFTLDRLGRIIQCITRLRATAGGANVVESDVSYTLDIEGNRLSATGGTHPGNYTLSNLVPPGDHEMNQYTTWPGGDLAWDANNCLTSMSDGATHFTLVYDACSRLVAVNDPINGTAIATYGYDAEGRRTRSTIASNDPLVTPVSTYFIHDGDECIQELGDDGLPNFTFATGGTGFHHCVISKNGTLVYPNGGGASTDTVKISAITMRFEKCVSTHSGDFKYRLFTGSTGAPSERTDCDDGGRPIFLTSEGIVRPGATSTLSGYAWLGRSDILMDMKDQSLKKVLGTFTLIGCGLARYMPETGLFQCDSGIYYPDIGQGISAHKEKPKPKEEKPHKKEYTGHVTLLK